MTYPYKALRGGHSSSHSGKVIFFTPVHPLMLLLMFIAFLASLIALTLLVISAQGVLYCDGKVGGLMITRAIIIAYFISLASFMFSSVNLKVYEVRRRVISPVMSVIVVFGIPYPVPAITVREERSVIAVNVGGALIPLIISMALLWVLLSEYPNASLALAYSIGLVTLASFITSRPVPGVGIAVPAMIPPLVSSITALLTTSNPLLVPVIAYISSTVGTLVGADILRLMSSWRQLKARLIIIGGAGTFDGIYLSGVLAVILTILMLM